MPRTGHAATARLPAVVNHVYLLLMALAIAGILTAAMTLQYAKGELPCPLCLLERVALFGVCFGIMQNLRHGFSYRNTGYSMLFAIFLLVVSVRQSLLDIYPRPGHAYIGSAIFGIHMPVWSIIIALTLLIAYAVKLSCPQAARRHPRRLSDRPLPGQPRLGRAAVRLRRVPHLRLQAAAIVRDSSEDRGLSAARDSAARRARSPAPAYGHAPRTARGGALPLRWH